MTVLMGKKSQSIFDRELEATYRDRSDAVHAVAARAGHQDSADIVQEAFLKTVEAGRRQDIGSPFGFLLRVARNSVIDRFRHRARWARLVGRSDLQIDHADPAPDAERALIASERLRRALACIDRMPPRRREVFLLHRIEGITYVQIARRLGISPKTVEDHLSAAMAQLSREMEQDDRSSD